jgi:hypothetical protein
MGVSEGLRGFRRLQAGLAYNDIVEVWTALCEEKGLDPRDTQRFIRFLRYVDERKIRVNSLPVCPKMDGWRGELAQRAARFFKAPLITFVIRTDRSTLSKLAEFTG